MKILSRTKKWKVSLAALALFWFEGGIVLAQQIRVVTTIPDLADITKQIGKDLVRVESLAKGVEFMHAVPAKPSFLPKLNQADLLILMGLDMELSWIPALLEVANNSRILLGQSGYIDCSVGVKDAHQVFLGTDSANFTRSQFCRQMILNHSVEHFTFRPKF
jgi:ABC-type Zn uptake system ZnuABC Zn-binding protein ZnuA